MPKTVTTTTTVYGYEELSERAQERARQWYRQAASEQFDASDMDSVLDDAAQVAKLLGIRIDERRGPLMGGGERMEPEFSWGIDSQDAGAHFTGTWEGAKVDAQAVREHAPQDAELHEIAAQLSGMPTMGATITRRSWTRAVGPHAVDIGVERDAEEEDANEVDPVVVKGVQNALMAFMHWIHARLEAEWEWMNSDEAVASNIEANGYEFLEDGERA